jgi:putative intracellular protease/amidase
VSPTPELPDELHRLLSALVDGTLDAADEQRLAELLRTNLSARASYYDHVMLESLLRREGRRAAAQSEPTVPVGLESEARIPLQLRADGDRRPTIVRGRLRPWLLVLAASVLLCLLLSVGEATGVTRFVPTIIRIVSGEGSLVIEVDDPAISVKLDGEDVTITGAGLHELRLRPGTHKLIASKDGQPLREEAVTIERGGKRVLAVSREPLAPRDQPSAEPPGRRPAGASETARRARVGDYPFSPRQPRVLIVLPSHAFYYPAYLPVRDTLIRADVKVLVAAPTLEPAQPEPVNPGHVPVRPDLLLADVQGADYDAIYFCGGKGVEEFISSGPYAAEARRLIAEALAAQKYVTALSTGPLVLADAGVLSGLRATCYPWDNDVHIERLKNAGAIWVDEPVVVSRLIITGRHPGDTREFSAALLEQLGVCSTAAQP